MLSSANLSPLGPSTGMRAAMVYGARMWLTFNANVMHFFDDETKRNILKLEANDIY